jgi:hypothetical protein
MTFPLFTDDNPNDLGNDAKWKIIGDVIDFAITEEYTRTATMSALREQGFTFGDAKFRNLWNTLADYRVRFEYPTTINPDELPSINTIQPSSRIELGVFQYKAYFSYYNENLERDIEQYMSINSTDLLTANEAIEKLWQFAAQNYNVMAESLNEFYYIGALRGTA